MPTVDGGEPVEEMDESQLVGVSVTVDADSAAAGAEASSEVCVVEVREEVKVKESGCEKRKRGRPARGQAGPPPAKRKKKVEEEEDVCFICFDGGSLVLCDRRGCPKAYHPACVKRDEAFFRSRAKWNCGWHICTVCQKAAHYMCYTCPYSLCKACTKDSNYLCVRENKGFCTTCMRIIMLIENNDQGSNEMGQVDFDDKSSWEYLFKVYWIYLKGKLSLTLDELIQAKNPWKAAGTVACKGQSLNMKCSALDSTYGQLQANNSKRKKPKLANNVVSPSTEKPSSDKGTNATGSTLWASKELLEFVGHMKNGDTSVLSQFDVQGLLLDYIKRNSLRDPRRKSQIICDLRLKTLFGKPCVGHFEMLRLLEFHFITKEDSRKDVTIQGNDVDAALSQVEGGGNNENLLMIGKDKKHKNCRKVERRGAETNLDEYAAIDVHNINLIYLPRALMENLIVDNGKFHDKVVGAIVRIRISSSDQKPDMYRLVQVIGICKVAVPYKIGNKTTDVKLEILNLDKQETISIDVISNQEFSEDECRRFRQSIKCGLVKRLTVGQVQQKAMALQEVRLNDWLEMETLRLNHLRDRASEKGHKKELRECVEKLELLKTPEERHRRLHEIPEIHADPNMDPNYESDEDAGEVSNKKQDEYVKPRYSGFTRYGKRPISSRNADNSNESDNRANKKIANCNQSRRVSSKFYLDKGAPDRVVERPNESSYWHEAKYACGSNCSENLGNQVDSSGSVVGCWNNQAMMRSVSFAEGVSETSIASLSTGSGPSANDSEAYKLWHYRDPSGKIQGPFCMVQLRKWNKTGYFPVNMRIWSMYDDEVNSLLLTDVLNGEFRKVFQLQNLSLPFHEVKGVSDARLCRQSGSMDTTGVDNRHSGRGWTCSTAIVHSNCNNEFVKGDGWGSHSSCWTAPVVNNNVQTPSSQCCDLQTVDNSFSDQLQVRPVPSSKFTEKQNEKPWHQGNGGEGERWNSGPNNENWRSHGDAVCWTTDGWSHENQSDTQGCSGQSSGGSWTGLPLIFSSNNRVSNSGFGSVAKSTDSLELRLEIDNQNLPSPTPKASNGDLEAQITKDQMCSLSALVQDSGIQKLASPTPESSDGDEKVDSSNNLPGPSPKPVDGNERGYCNTQNLASSSSKLVDGPEKIDSNIQNLSSSSPKRVDGEEKSDSSIQNLPSPPLMPVDGNKKIDSNVQNLPCPSSKKPREGDEKVQANEYKQPVSSDIPFQESGPSWSSASSLVVGGERQLSEIADDSGGYSSRAKPSVEEWDSGIASVSSLKPPEMASDHAATPTSKFDQVTSPSPSDPVSSLRPPEMATDHAATPTSKFDQVTSPSLSDPVSSLRPPEMASDHAATPTSKFDQVTSASPSDPMSSFRPPEMASDHAATPTSKFDQVTSASPSDPVSSLRPPEMASDHAATPTSKFDQVTSPSPSDPVSSLRPPDMASDHAATPTSKFDQVTSASPSDPVSNASGWQVSITEPIEFCTLAEESVSDLLAEVDAMESQCSLPSPTSVMCSGEELFQDSNHDYFPYIGGLSPLDSGKSDALSSTGDISLPHQSTLTYQADFLDPGRCCSGQSSSSAEVEVEIRPNDISANQMEAGSNSQLPAFSTLCWDTMGTDTAGEQWPKLMSPGWGTMQGDVNFSLGGLTRGMVNVGSGTGNGNVSGSSPAGVMGWDCQPRYGGERFDGPRDLAYGGGGGSNSRSPPKGQGVCKFYESGYCRNGAFCDNLHPR